MIEGILDRYALCRVECEQFLDKIKEVPVDRIGGWDDFLHGRQRSWSMQGSENHQD